MKDKLRNYKHRTVAAEHATIQQNGQILIMEKAIATLKQQLAVSQGTPRCHLK
jgi:hypothetical protein